MISKYKMNSYFRKIEIWALFFYLVCLRFCFFVCFSFFLLIFLILFYLFLTFFETLQENDLTFLVFYKNTNSNFSGTLQKVVNMSEYNSRCNEIQKYLKIITIFFVFVFLVIFFRVFFWFFIFFIIIYNKN